MDKKKVGLITTIIAFVIVIVVIVFMCLKGCSNNSPKEESTSCTTVTTTQSENIDITISDNTVPVTEEATEEGTYDKRADVEIKLIDGRDGSKNSDANSNNSSNIIASRVD